MRRWHRQASRSHRPPCPAGHAADRQDKIDLGFNYFTHTADRQPSVGDAIERTLGWPEPAGNPYLPAIPVARGRKAVLFV